MSTTVQSTRVETLVKRGWRRRLLVLAVDQSAPVLALIFAALSLLILLGTQILAWQWLLAIAAAGITVAVLSVRRQMSDPYGVAQLMDHRLSLQDSLSTAWFLRTCASAEDQSAAAYQLKRTELIAQSADPALAFPFQRRRAWFVTTALFILAFSLFSVRYLVTRELSLRHSFLPAAIAQVFGNIRDGFIRADPNNPEAAGRQSPSLPPPSLGQERARTPKSESGEKAAQQSAPNAANAKSDQAPDQNAQQAKAAEGGAGDQKSTSAGDPSQDKSNQQASNSPNQQDSKEPDQTGAQHSNSLMDRMRDALSSVMAKIKPSGTQQNSQSASQKNADGQKSADQGNKDQSGDGQKDAGKEQSAQEQSSGEQQGQGASKAEAAQGKDSAQPSDKKGSDAQSGVGHSDGDKQIKEAEQQKALGKLAEIIGKRSASLTGDMQIEPSGKQRLQTGYTHQQGQHADSGGEINRDEIPVEDQEYVREYMELVRKKPAKPPKP